MKEEKTLFETIGIQYEEKDGLLYPIFRACQLKCVSFLFPLVFKGCSVDGADRYSGHF